MASRYCARCLSTFTDDAESCPNLGCGGKRPTSGWGMVLGPGDELDRHYRIVRPLAVGGAGLTYLARAIDGSGQAVAPDLAVKVLYAQRASGPYLRRLATEFQILQDLDHEHIVKCRGFVQRAGQEPYLVTLFELGGSLGAAIEERGPVDALVAVGILRQVLTALDVAHQRGVVHRDLKPDNVLLCDRAGDGVVPKVRVSDFGIAKVAGGDFSKLTRTGSFVGTPEYAAPEQFLGEAATPATDVFAAGALLWYLLHGRAPVQFTERTDVEGCYESWLAALPPRLDPGAIRATPRAARALGDVLVGMLAVAPEDRWTVQQVLKALRAVTDAPAEVDVPGTLELTAGGTAPRSEAPTRTPRPAPVLVPPRTAGTLETAPVVAAGGAGCALAGAGLAGVAALAAGVGLVLALVAASDPPRVLLGSTDGDDRALRRSLQAAVDARAVGLSACRGGVVLATLEIDRDGRTAVVATDGDAGDCVRRAVDGLQLPNLSTGPVRARLGWLLVP